MKNNFRFLLGFFFLNIIFQNIALTEEFKFESNTINTIDKDTVLASGNIIITNKIGQKIFGDKLTLNKNTKIHELVGNVFFKDINESQISSEILIIDENKRLYTFSNNVVYYNRIHDFKLDTENIIYDQSNNTYKTSSITKINYKNEIFAKTSDLILERDANIFFSNKKSRITDNLKNIIDVEKFKFFILKKRLDADNVKITDKEKNIYEIKSMKYDLNKKIIYGKDIYINKDNKDYIPTKHLGRSKSRMLVLNKDFSTLKKSVYTSCTKRDGCPPWLLVAEEVSHDKKKKIVNYKNTTLKLFDIPVFYFPKFFHPDPTVKRQSGFLTPTVSAAKSNNYFQVPYFFAISENSDFTFSPRVYGDLKNLYQGEYRNITKNSYNILDFSVKNDNPLLLDKNTTASHIFLNSAISSNFDYFDNSKFDIKLEVVSDEKYLKSFDVISPIINSQTSLKSTVGFNGFNNDTDLSISAEVYEDLSKDNTSDRYEYVLPNFLLSKNLVTDLDGLSEFNTSGYYKLYNTNVKEKILINNLKYKSSDNFTKIGFINNFEINLKNFNSNSEKSIGSKNVTQSNIQGIIQLDSKLPLVKKGFRYDKTITPIVSAKINPMKNQNINHENRMIDYNNLFSINRVGSNEILEGGLSLSLGNEYKIFDKLKSGNEIFTFNLGTSLRIDENPDLPTNSSLGKKTSHFIGQMNFNPFEFLDLDYDFVTENNLSDLNYHKIKSNFKINNFITSFEFIEENNIIGDESFLANETSYNFNQNQNLLFRTRKNKKTNLTEYYDLIYQYKLDCLTAGIEYKKSYYNDGSLKPKEGIFFSISFMPFNNTVSLPGVAK
jgi:LPS-assembly protein